MKYKNGKTMYTEDDPYFFLKIQNDLLLDWFLEKYSYIFLCTFL